MTGGVGLGAMAQRTPRAGLDKNQLIDQSCEPHLDGALVSGRGINFARSLLERSTTTAGASPGSHLSSETRLALFH